MYLWFKTETKHEWTVRIFLKNLFLSLSVPLRRKRILVCNTLRTHKITMQTKTKLNKAKSKPHHSPMQGKFWYRPPKPIHTKNCFFSTKNRHIKLFNCSKTGIVKVKQILAYTRKPPFITSNRLDKPILLDKQNYVHCVISCKEKLETQSIKDK